MKNGLPGEKWTSGFGGHLVSFPRGGAGGHRPAWLMERCPLRPHGYALHANGDNPDDRSLNHPVGPPAALEGEKIPSSTKFPSHPSHGPQFPSEVHGPSVPLRGRGSLSSAQRQRVPQFHSEAQGPSVLLRGRWSLSSAQRQIVPPFCSEAHIPHSGRQACALAGGSIHSPEDIPEHRPRLHSNHPRHQPSPLAGPAVGTEATGPLVKKELCAARGRVSLELPFSQ